MQKLSKCKKKPRDNRISLLRDGEHETFEIQEVTLTIVYIRTVCFISLSVGHSEDSTCQSVVLLMLPVQ